MRPIAGYTIKELEAALAAPEVSEEFLAACREDPRKAAARLVRRYEKAQAEHARLLKMYAYEHEAWARGHEIVAGVDEAGRGPLAGPVSVAAVILPHDLCLPKLNDSKKLSAKVREELFDEIQEKAIAVGTALIDAQTIDRVNIYQATINGMYEAIFSLQPEPQEVLIDAVPLENLPMASQSIIKGDAKSASIAAASLIAKVTRDRLMDEYDKIYPEYGFAQHKGYGTAQHIEALKKYGPCPIHRRSFEPVRSLVRDF
ncbi:ribonuclease HII [uncultured Mitsuokella sp.]|uniref:ribonuclease HII n=1 Tax=uncultured Mitsuokella sp. TaxID=453120 RepID=UPI00266FEDA8|nr:ribonuclease HII [uncultured Mitsuokella sp.]